MQTTLEARPVTAREFCDRVATAFSDREAENNLPFGLAQRLAARAEPTPGAVLLSIEAGGVVVGGAVWTPPYDIVVTRLPPGGAELVASYCTAQPAPITGTAGPGGAGLELAETLARQLGAAIEVRARQRVYELRRVNDVPRAAGAARAASSADLPLVARWYAAFAEEVKLPHTTDPATWARGTIAAGNAILWEHEEPCAIACFARETEHGRSIGPVYTPREARRNGYATSLVAELSRQTLAAGRRFACLFTDDSNPTSNHIYEAIGFELVCRYDAYRLSPAAAGAER